MLRVQQQNLQTGGGDLPHQCSSASQELLDLFIRSEKDPNDTASTWLCNPFHTLTTLYKEESPVLRLCVNRKQYKKYISEIKKKFMSLGIFSLFIRKRVAKHKKKNKTTGTEQIIFGKTFRPLFV